MSRLDDPTNSAEQAGKWSRAGMLTPDRKSPAHDTGSVVAVIHPQGHQQRGRLCSKLKDSLLSVIKCQSSRFEAERTVIIGRLESVGMKTEELSRPWRTRSAPDLSVYMGILCS